MTHHEYGCLLVQTSLGPLWSKYILVHFDLIDLFHLRAVSRTTYTLVSDYWQTMDQLDLSTVSNNRFNWAVFRLLTEKNCSLRKLILTNSRWLEEKAFNEFFSQIPNLNELNLSGAYSVNNSTLTNVATFCPSLTKIILQRCCWLNRESLLLMIERCQRLVEIDLSSCWNVDDYCVQQLFQQRGSTLRRVVLARLYSLSDQCIEAICQQGVTLRELDISFCWRITDQGARNLGKMTNLERITLSGCSGITFLGHKYLANRGIQVISQNEFNMIIE